MSVVISDAWRQRFGGTARLYGEKALQLFADAHICVVGIGGAQGAVHFPADVQQLDIDFCRMRKPRLAGIYRD